MAYGWRGEGLSSEGEPERMSGRADSIGRTYQDDSERSSRRKANEAETGWSQPAHKLQTRPTGKGPRCANFYVAFGTFVGRPFGPLPLDHRNIQPNKFNLRQDVMSAVLSDTPREHCD